MGATEQVPAGAVGEGEVPERGVMPGVRLLDVPGATVEDRLRVAGHLGYRCVQLPSKLLYASYGIDRFGLTPGLALHLREVSREAGVAIVVLGCYRNLALTEDEGLEGELEEFLRCARFAQWLGGCMVATECGRPNPAGTIDDARFTDAALERFCHGLDRALTICRGAGVTLAMEPGYNETVLSAERCRQVLDVMAGRGLGVLWDPVSLLHPSVLGQAQGLMERFIELCGDEVIGLHMKDCEVVADERRPEWCDGTGGRLVCHGVGQTGVVDLSPVLSWARQAKPWIPAIVENGSPDALAGCLSRLL